MNRKKKIRKQKTWNIVNVIMLGTILSVLIGGIFEQKVQAATEQPQEDRIEISGILYKVINSDEKTLSCIGLANQNSTYVKIPSKVEMEGSTYKVTDIAIAAFKDNKNIKKVTLGENIISIGKQAFYGCTQITYIEIYTEKLQRVEAAAFKGVKGEIVVHKNQVKNYSKLINGSFNGTTVITSNGIFQVTSEKKLTVSYLGTAKEKATTIKVPDTIKISSDEYKVTKIADKALKNNTKVKKVYIGENVITIGKDAFTGCKNLTYIKISSLKLKKVGSSKLGGKKGCDVNVPKSKQAYYIKLLKKIKK